MARSTSMPNRPATSAIRSGPTATPTWAKAVFTLSTTASASTTGPYSAPSKLSTRHGSGAPP